MIQGVDYQRHVPQALRKHAYKVTYSVISSLLVGQTVYRIREKPGYLLIGHTFHRSMPFDREKLECWSNDGSKLLAKVEIIK